MGLRLRNGHLDNARIKVKNAKLRNPDLVVMGVLVVASFSISRIRYLLARVTLLGENFKNYRGKITDAAL